MIVFDLACDAGHVFEAWFGTKVMVSAEQRRAVAADLGV